MSFSGPTDPGLVAQLLRFENGELSDSEVKALIEALRDDPAQRSALIETLRMSQSLRAVGEKQSAELSVQKRLEQPAKKKPVNSRRVLRASIVIWNLVAVLAIGAVGVWIVLQVIDKSDEASVVSAPPAKSEAEVTAPDEDKTLEQTPVSPEKAPAFVEVRKTTEPLVAPQTKEPKDVVAIPEPNEEPMVAEVSELKPEPTPVLLGYRWPIGQRTGSWYSGEQVMSGDHNVESGSFKYRLNNGIRFDVDGPTKLQLEGV